MPDLRMSFGKHEGKLVSTLKTGYLNWLIEQTWFGLEKHDALRECVDDELVERMDHGEYTP